MNHTLLIPQTFSLTAAQRDIWLDQVSRGDSPLYNIGGYIEINGHVCPAVIQHAVELLVEKHDALRTVLLADSGPDGVPLQSFAHALPVRVPLHDFSTQPDPLAAAQVLMQQQMALPYPLDTGPLFRFFLIKLEDEHFFLGTQAHHLILDGWGFGQMLQSLGSLYSALEQEGEPDLSAASYIDFIHDDHRYHHSARYARDRAYWLDKYQTVPEPLLVPRYRDRHVDGIAPSSTVVRPFPVVLHERMGQLAKTYQASPFHVLLAALYVYFTRTTQRDEWVVGLPILNRPNAGFKSTLGLFTQVSAVRLRFSNDLSFGELIRAVRDVLRQDFRHQRFPLSEMNRALGLLRDDRAQLFDLSVSYEQEDHDYRYGQALAHSVKVSNNHEQTPLTLHLRTNSYHDKAWAHYVYNEAYFERTEIESLAERFTGVLEQGLEAPDGSIRHFTLMTPAEAERLRQWNATEKAYPGDQTLHQLIEAQVAARPHATAVTYAGLTLSYGELNARANQVAHRLLAMGVRPDDRVAICVERGLEMVVGLLGILKAGAGYVPLDPEYPSERLTYMIENSAPTVLLTQQALLERLSQTAAPVLLLDAQGRDAEEIGRQSRSNPDVGGLSHAALAYVIYTSGSTGQPKGVAMPHGPLVNLMQWQLDQATQQGRGAQRTLQFAALGFDVAFQEVFSTLCAGGELSMIHADIRLNFRHLFQHICEHRIERLYLPCIALQALTETVVGDEQLSQLPCALADVITAGEQLRITEPMRTFFRGLQGCRLHNHYGPTESHVTTALTLAGDATGWPVLPSIGQPVANTRIHLLDEQLQPVPPGVAGEIYIGGACVARGYLNREDLTRERFIVDPFVGEGSARLYQSGDLGCYQANGDIEYLGRNDGQIKIRGFRVEPGEVEARLARHPGVREAAVVVREEVAGDKRLVAYFTAYPGQALPDVDALRRYLQGLLPDYMIPAAYVRLETLPLSPNGKLDRRALPMPQAEAFVCREYEAPVGIREITLARLWAELLNVERVGRHDHFFELGGHSLLAVNLIERMRRAGLSADVRVLFTQPTLAALAAATDGGTEVEVPANRIPVDCTRITPDQLSLAELDQASIDCIVATVPGGAANVQEIYPLAPLQEGLLYHHLSAEESDPYQQHALFAFEDEARLHAFVQALQAVVSRHDILRTSLVWEGIAQPMQVVWREARLSADPIALEPGAGDIVEQLRERLDPRHFVLGIRRAPMMRVCYAEDPANTRWVGMLVFHHLVNDATSLGVLIEEVAAHMQGREQDLAPPVPYRNYVAQARWGVSQEEHEAFFRQQLSDVDEPTLALGLHHDHGDHEEGHALLEASLSQRLRGQARQLGVSAACVCHLAWARVVGCLAGRDDVVFGTVLLGRLQAGEGADRALGMFINTLPLRVNLGEHSVQAAVKATHARLNALLAHEHASLALAQRCSGVAAPTPLFNTLFNYRHGGVSDEGGALRAWQGIELLGSEEVVSYPLIVSVDDLGEGFKLSAVAPRDVGAQRILGYLHTALQGLVETLEHGLQTPLHSVPVLVATERQQVLFELNATETDYPCDQTIHALFEAQVRRTPDSVALLAGEQQLTYRELNERANQLARHLRQLGVKPDSRVAICVERGPELVIGLLGILKAGGAYVPLDPGYPRERIAYMLQDSAPVAVLVQGTTHDLLDKTTVPVIDLDHPTWQAQSVSNPQVPGLTVSHLAYVIYTSGSTGTPKGVMVEHRGVNNLVHWSSQVCGGTQDAALLQKTPFSFDASVWEFFWPLTTGMRLVLARPDGHREPAYMAQLIREQRITVIQFVPAMLQQFLELDEVSQCVSLTDVFCGGGELTAALARRVQERLPQVRLHNVYGPTEATVDSTVWTLEPGATIPDVQLPIGRPIANTRLYVLDAHDAPVPLGVSGHLHIGGVGVTRGYVGLPQLTAERFIDSPFVAGDRLYRTGDLVRYRPDGNLEFLGRNDFQVKLRGVRLELGEIEALLAAHPAVREAVVLARDERLVAYFTPRVAGQIPAIEALRAHLLAQLPEHMVPAAYVHLDALPLSPNGKLDRRALPAPDQDALMTRRYEAPQGEVETVLAQIWADVLKVERVGRHDHFFELGGHSLLAVSLIERMRQAGLSADVRVLFGQPTLAALAAAVGGGREIDVPVNRIPFGCTHITPDLLPLADLDQAAIDRIVATVPGGVGNVQDIYPLAPLQAGILYHHLSVTQGDPYVLQVQFAFDNDERLEAFAQALQAVIERHDILRTAMTWESLDEPVQVVWRQAPLGREAVESDPKAGDVLTRLHARFDPRHYRLDITQAPLMRLVHARDEANQRVVAVLLFHHMVMDHVALEVLQHEIGVGLLGQQSLLGEAVPYRNYVAQTRLGISEQEHEMFFREMLGDVDEPTLPFGLQDVQGDGSGIEEATQRVPADVSQRLRAQARVLGVSAASLFHLAWAQVLAGVSGKEHVVFGTVMLGRMQGGEGTEQALGLFINTLPLRIDVGAQGARAGVEAIHARLTALLGHEHAPLVLAQRCSGVVAPSPLFSALLNYRHSATDTIHHHHAWHGIELLSAEERTNYPLTLNVDDLGDGFNLNAMTVARIGAQRICGYVQTALESLVEALEQDSPVALNRLPMLPAAERRYLVFDLNATDVDYPLNQTIHGLFESQVQRTPDAPAVLAGEQRLTYRELNQRANQLAHHLRLQGVGPDSRVAICVERGLDMVVGLLAILKAGGGYVPLDPAYPLERIAYMLHDSAPAAVLVQGTTRELLGEVAVPVIDLDHPTWQAQSVSNPQVPALTPAHLVYVIYTSGSTGQPKGVINEHGAVVNRLLWMQDEYRLTSADAVLQKTPFSFDVSVWEFFWPLFTGARLVMARPEGHKDPAYLCEVIHAEQITTLHFVPSMLDVFLAHGDVSQCAGLKRVMCSGEALPGSLVRRFKVQLPGSELHNLYGPTEAAVDVTAWNCAGPLELTPDNTPIGKPIANTRLYLLDGQLQPVPQGVVGELYIGGVQVARGYLHRPELTAERFLNDPFSSVNNARMYRTGDVARYLADGNIEYLGRNDDQVKIRGLRIELGEIQARLTQFPEVKEAVVLAREDVPGDKRLVAYYTTQASAEALNIETLRSHLLEHLPEYMVPSVFVHLDALPLSPNGKLDRKALPAPGLGAMIMRGYEAPQGDVETTLAQIWAELLKVERVGRHDHFFELGGHSLLAVSLIERMRRGGLSADVRVLFGQPTLAALAAAVGSGREIRVPANLIPPGCERITPELLPLADLNQAAIDRIVATVPGGTANVQDIYPLAPLQAGILYHHLSVTQGDPYVMQVQFAFDNEQRLEAFAQALQAVIGRHDILRTAMVWENLDQPVQVVWRQAPLGREAVEPDLKAGDVLAQLHARFDPRHYRLDITQAPLMRLVHARDEARQRVVAMLLFHHLVMDHVALDVLQHEIRAFLLGQQARLGEAVAYRNYVAQTRLGISEQEHETFFREMLGDVDEPTLPFGLQDVQGDGSDIEEVSQPVQRDLGQRLRAQARTLGVSAASLFHLAWAQVLAGVSGKASVVFGTVLLGRMQGGEGAEHALGMFINTLPLRVDIDETGVEAGVRATHARLTALLGHEHASLALAQRCSGVAAPAPLFSALLNYRHSAVAHDSAEHRSAWQGIEVLSAQERTNYPLTLSVDDRGEDFGLTAMAVSSIGARRICGYMHTALEHLVHALAQTPQVALNHLSILPLAERQQLLVDFNTTHVDYPQGLTIHQRVEAQAAKHPQAMAAFYQGQSLSYGQLNQQANQLAHHLRDLGVQPDDRVAIVARRGLDTLVGLLAILKSGACYVPIDPSHPAERLSYLLSDSGPVAVLTQQDLLARLPVLDVPVIELDRNRWQDQPITNPQVAGLTPAHLAYVIYTSGSTGLPKGVMVEHRTLENLVNWHCDVFNLHHGSHTSSVAGFGFDAMAWEVWPALCVGATLHLPPAHDGNEDIDALLNWWRAQPLDVSFLPTPVAEYAFSQDLEHPTLRTLLVGGDRLRQFSKAQRFALINNYGPTEATVVATSGRIEAGQTLHIGKPMANAKVYLLDEQMRPVPVGVAGELYVGGAGVARGYLNRPQMTAEHFLKDPFSDDPQARMYRTGDLARWLADGNIEYLGRNDDQVKIRGMRIELGEIEAKLTALESVKEAVVMVRDGRLVAYFTEHTPLEIEQLRTQLQATLPDYMLPSAYVKLEFLPLTANGKLDRKALPAPDQASMLSRGYEAPQGEVETTLAQIWAEVLKVERVGRHDHFFELGGHSLLAVSLIERMRQAGLSADVRVLFSQPTLAALAAAVGGYREVIVPANRITPDCERITPDLLPLADLNQDAIDRIVATVPGGAANVQDIYPLAPLQEGILYHHITAEQGDPYLLQSKMAFDSLERLQAFAQALQKVIERHDILRTGVVWEGLQQPMQVVWCQAELTVQEVLLDPAAGDILGQLHARFDARHYRLEVTQAPLIRMMFACDQANQRVVAVLLFHHMALDHTTMEVVGQEMRAYLFDQAESLGPAVPYRNYVAQARLGVSEQDHEMFFREMLSDIDEPTLPFGLQDVQGDGNDIEEATQPVPAALNLRVRAQARQLGVSAASVFHLAWAQVLSQVSNRQEVVFGTVLMGRMQGGEGADRALGMFINTLPLRVNLGETGVQAGVKATHARLTALLGHEHASLALAQRCSGVAAPSPLFSALLNYRHSVVDEPAQDGQDMWEGIESLGGDERTNYPLTLSVDDLGNGFSLTVLAVPHAGAQRMCGYMQAALASLIDALEQTPQVALNHLSILPPAERRQLLVDFNATRVDYPHGETVHAVFEAQVVRIPDALAVCQGEQHLTYRELNQCANQLAHYLRDLGVQPDDRVAIVARRGLDTLVGLLAILKSGACYVPVDPSHPAERLSYLLSDSGPVAVLTQQDLLARLPVLAVPVIELDRNRWQDQPITNPQVAGLTPAHLAYVIYTSGSTGLPKGVMVEHHTLENLVNWHCDAFNLHHGSHTSSVAGFGFDAMAWEVWPALCVGATLHLPPAHDGNEDIDALLNWWRAQPLDVSFLPTPVAEYAFSHHLEHPTLRTLLVGGDRLRQFSKAQRFELINNYGPTEATVVATSGRIEVGQTLHIGKPMANAKVYLLDEQMRPVPVGVAGELYVGGAGVARGYLNRPELTAERFLQDPFSSDPQARMYRTGDLARWLADGTIEYLGRNDDQVKIRGVRIELGEIETKLAALDAVKEAVVLVRDGRLVAYFTEHTPLEIEQLRAQLQAILPDYMLPSAYVRLDNLPLTANGKLDRKALPDPDLDALIRRGYEAPQGEVETTLAQIWAEVLKVERVGRHDHFFELGGHSLLAVSLIECMRQAGLSADVRVLFSQPTLAALAAAVGSGREIQVPANLIPPGCTRITPDLLPLADLNQDAIDRIVATVPGGVANVQDIYPLAPLQEGILYHHITAEQGDPYQQHAMFAFDNRERLDAFVRALQGVIARHDILRTSLVWDRLEVPMQVVWRKAELTMQEVALDPAAGDTVDQLRERFDPRRYRLDLRQAPMMFMVYAQDPGNNRWVGMLVFHHLVNDATSMGVLVAEIEAHVLGQAHHLAPPMPYRNYVAQTRLGTHRKEHEAFFREMLGDIDEPTLAFGVQSGSGIYEEREHLLDASFSRRLRVQARRLGVSAASLYHLAWAHVLGSVSGRDDVVFGTVLLGRLQAGEGADRTLGMFINTLPLRVNPGEHNVQAAVKATHVRLSALLAHEHAPLTLAQRCSGVAAPTPLFNALLNYRHGAQSSGDQAQRAWQGIEILGRDGNASYPLILSVDDLGDDFRLGAQTLVEIGAQRVIGYMQVALEGLLEALEHNPQQSLQGLPVLPAQERNQLLVDFNVTDVDFPLEQTLHGLFEAQVLRTPDASAVLFGEQRLTYHDLNKRANQLAHHLSELGVQPDSRVAICVERGPELVIGLLGILKAGGAYVPLDPGYPRERIAYMLQDSAPVAVLVQGTTHDLLDKTTVPVIDLDHPTWQAQSVSNPQVPGLTASHLAYVIYTSGSTGTPKGVMVEHRGVNNLVHWSSQVCGGTQDAALLQKTPFSFDASVWEFFWSLTTGMRLVLARPDGHREPAYMAQLIREQRITVIQFVPAMLQQFLELDEVSQCVSLTDVFCGGGELTAALARRVQERLPQVRLHNVYGPTEATVDSTVWTLEPGATIPDVQLPIGRPIANTRLYVLDAHDVPVPIGVTGHLHIGGVGVARGYVGLAQLTAERFISDPFSQDSQARMYRTGDRVRYRADGNLEYLGRTDDQVKIRGLRIEPGEIQACLSQFPEVQEALVLAREDMPGDMRLVAYYTTRTAGDSVAIDTLRSHLLEQMPDYMVPSVFVHLDAWPLSPNGKLDRKALPAPGQESVIARGYEAPVGETETTLARLWAELLNVERVGRHDHFFELGGHSLLAVSLAERMRKQGLDADLRALLRQPTLAQMADAVGHVQRLAVPETTIPTLSRKRRL